MYGGEPPSSGAVELLRDSLLDALRAAVVSRRTALGS
jgi:hypothetical protein